MKLRETELIMCAAAQTQKRLVIVDRDGRTYRGIARSFSDWYQTDSGYAILFFDTEEAEAQRICSRDILYIELHG